MSPLRVEEERTVTPWGSRGLEEVTSIGIRQFRLDDAEAMWQGARESINELTRWMVWCKSDYSLEKSAAFISRCAREWEEKRSYSFVIFNQEDASFLGSVGLNGIDCAHKVANVGFWVRTKQTGRGVATAAIGLAIRFAFNQTELNRLEFVVPVGNHRSQRAVEKNGATREGLLRKRVILEGEPTDALMYAIVKED